MPNRPRTEPDPDVLPDPVAARVLARASELDAARAGGSPVADLRAAAAEAGISAEAFETALAEVQGAGSARRPEPGDRPRRRGRRWPLFAGAAALIATAALVGTRDPASSGVDARPGAATVEEAVVLRCLTPGEAAELVRPALQDPSSQVTLATARAPRVLTIRAMPALLRKAKALLAEQDAAGSAACAPRPAPVSP